MTKDWILFHLREVHAELARTIAAVEAADIIDDIEFEIAVAHMYNHLNTAWNTRAVTAEEIAAQTDEDFYRWREFPTDISMGR